MSHYDVSRDDGSLDILSKSEIRTGMLPEVISGLADIRMESVVPLAVGIGGTMLTTFALNRFGYFGSYAPLVGIAGGGLLSLALNFWSQGGTNAVAQGVTASVLTGVGLFVKEKMDLGAFGALVAAPAGALVAEPVGALVASPVGYLPSVGETAGMPGRMGPVDIQAFGRA